MPNYRYRAIDAFGKTIRGEMTTESPTALDSILTSQGMSMVWWEENDGTGHRSLFERIKASIEKPTAEGVIQFLDELSVYIDAGISITHAMDECASSTTDQAMRRVIIAMKQNLNSGDNFCGAMEKHKQVFDEMLIGSVRVGEESGNLASVITSQIRRLQKDLEIRKKIRGQSIYPAILITVVVALMIVMNTMIIPKLMESFAQLGVTNPPRFTAVLIKANKFLMDYGWLLPGVIIGIVVAWIVGEHNKTTKRFKDSLLIRLPVIKQVIIFATLARVSEGMAMGLQAGLQTTGLLEFMERNIGNTIVRDKFRGIRQAILEGETLHGAAKANQLHPLFTSMVGAGEKSGSLPATLGKAQVYYHTKLDGYISTVMALSSVVVIIFLGLVVAFAMASIIVPMYELPTALT